MPLSQCPHARTVTPYHVAACETVQPLADRQRRRRRGVQVVGVVGDVCIGYIVPPHSVPRKRGAGSSSGAYLDDFWYRWLYSEAAQAAVPWVGLEPTTPRLVVGNSIRLSYQGLARDRRGPARLRRSCFYATIAANSLTKSFARFSPTFVKRYCTARPIPVRVTSPSIAPISVIGPAAPSPCRPTASWRPPWRSPPGALQIASIIEQRAGFTGLDEVKELFLEAQAKDPTYALAKGIIHDIRDVEIPSGAPIFQLVFQR